MASNKRKEEGSPEGEPDAKRPALEHYSGQSLIQSPEEWEDTEHLPLFAKLTRTSKFKETIRLDPIMLEPVPIDLKIAGQFKVILTAIRKNDKEESGKILRHIKTAAKKLDPSDLHTKFKVDVGYAVNAITKRLHKTLLRDSLCEIAAIFSRYPYHEVDSDAATDLEESDRDDDDEGSPDNVSEKEDDA